MWRLTLVAAIVAGVSGCGSEAASPPPDTRVVVTVRPDGSPSGERRTIVECPGDERCARLHKADFRPSSDAVACTQIYGGPATARVTGHIDGRTVDAGFDLHDGCAINRWQKFGWLLGRPPPARG